MRPGGRRLASPSGAGGASGRSPAPTDAEILGVDFGQRRIGLARATREGGVAGPWRTIEVRGREDALATLAHLVAEGCFVLVVFGLPVTAGGVEGPAARRVRRIGQALSRTTGVPVAFQDEYLSTREAMERTGRPRRRMDIDMLAAAVILQEYLNARGDRR